ncbi:MAG: pyruvate dehydrogenase (acetyl-transferring), homodimeric type [Acidimicrobiia bacterium]|nr:pyruvate dehydrogenase (acetyl-transferring), homodimeric type [Acidimicrobiia bacterium]
MILDGFVQQLPDNDPEETGEWLDALDSVIDQRGAARGRYIISKLTERARQRQVGTPAEISTPYINTIPPEHEAWFPGDEHIERRIRAYIRWNAAVMVVRANAKAEGIGGHLSTFASSAALYEVGFNWFFRGKANGTPGDHVYYQGHAAPGIYARAFLEGRLDEGQLDRFRRELSPDGPGLSSYPHPWLMEDFWEYPTVSMGLGPINSIYQARFLRYLENRRIDDTAESRVWCFLGDGECDEPETLGSISLAARERLDNLTWVVNCNLQRLDGPVRGNGKIIQELEAIFRGAGWNVIKVVWGSGWDELLAADEHGVLVNKMNDTPDGDFQRYAVSDGAHIRQHFFGPDPRLSAMVEHLSDDELRLLPRGGHDYRKLFAAYKAATEQTGAPTVILAKTVKGWTLGPSVESRNATHQIKKMDVEQLKVLRERLHLEDAIPLEALEAGEMPYYRPPDDAPEARYLADRRRALDGPVPVRTTAVRRPIDLPGDDAFAEFRKGSGEQEVSTTGVFTRLLRNLLRSETFGPRVVPIVPDEARTFGMDALFREFKIYAAHGQRYQPVDHDLLLSYAESVDGQILEEGITEAGSMGSWTAAGTAYANRGVPMVPFFIFYSMFGFQRVGDLIWAAADARTKGFLLGATAGRTTLAGEGLQHQDGHSHLLALSVPTCRAYDPAFAYEVAAIIGSGIEAMYGRDETAFYYLTLTNENYAQPPQPDHVADDEIVAGMYRFAEAPDGLEAGVSILFSGSAWRAAAEARDALAEHHGIGAELWSVTSWKALREDALAADRRARLRPAAGGTNGDTDPGRSDDDQPLVARLLGPGQGPVVVVTDYTAALPATVVPALPAHRPATVLGTDGFGRSDTRDALRRFFETDAAHVELAALSALARTGDVTPDAVAAAATRLEVDVDPTTPPPWER